MNLVSVLADRHAVTSCQDPDTLHGILFSLETDAQRAANAPVIHRILKNRKLLDRARDGLVGRVPAFAGDDAKVSQTAREFPDGLFGLRWKRDLIAAMLRPDGIGTTDLAALLQDCGVVHMSTSEAMHVLRQELRVFGVDVEAARLEHGEFRYRFIGQPAWRMQKIIANGWSV